MSEHRINDMRIMPTHRHRGVACCGSGCRASISLAGLEWCLVAVSHITSPPPVIELQTAYIYSSEWALSMQGKGEAKIGPGRQAWSAHTQHMGDHCRRLTAHSTLRRYLTGRGAYVSTPPLPVGSTRSVHACMGSVTQFWYTCVLTQCEDRGGPSFQGTVHNAYNVSHSERVYSIGHSHRRY